MKTKDLLHARGVAVENMKSLLAKVEAEGRDFNDDEQSQYNNWEKEQSELKARVDRINHQRSLEEPTANIDEPVRMAVAPGTTNSDLLARLSTKEYQDSFASLIRQGPNAMSTDFRNALEVGTDSEGGFIVPTEFDTSLVRALVQHNEFRQYATVIQTASTRNIPVESTRGVATWTDEEAAYTESDPALAQVVLGAHKLGRIIKVSEELVQDAFFDIFGWLAVNFGESFGIAEEAAFVAGDGSAKPTGAVVSSGLGVTAAGAAAITSDELLDLHYSLARPYRTSAIYSMADPTIKLVRKLKDTEGQYIWRPGLTEGEPDLKSVLFGDWKYYTIADRTNSTVQVLKELYAANGQVGYRMFKRTEGKVTLAAAFKHLIQA